MKKKAIRVSHNGTVVDFGAVSCKAVAELALKRAGWVSSASGWQLPNRTDFQAQIIDATPHRAISHLPWSSDKRPSLI